MAEGQQPLSKRLYPLTSLQIGDMQSYVSRLYLYLPEKSRQLVFIVDNGPWTTKRRRSMPAELWQAMVTKSRVSPFANRRLKFAEEQRSVRTTRPPPPVEVSNLEGGIWDLGWAPLLQSLQIRWKDMINVKKPSQLYGCVSFEVAWSDVRGINYLNELQTDTCVSLEVRCMRKREFDSLQQAEAWYGSPLACTQNDTVGQAGRKTLHIGSLAVGVQEPSGKDFWCQGLFSEGHASVASSSTHINGMSSERDSAEGVENQSLLDVPSSSRSSASSDSGNRGQSGPSGSGVWGWFRKLQTETESEFLTPPSSPTSIDLRSGQGNQSAEHSSESSGSGQKCRKRKPGYVGERSAKTRDRLKTTLSMKGFVESPLNAKCVTRNPVLVRSSSMPESMGSDSLRDCEMSSGLACSTSEMDRQCPRQDILGDKIFSKQVICGIAENSELYLYTHLARFIFPAGHYRDTFVSFRFAHPFLPFELEQIITADQRLLKMLESGLPSWVIFLQSYPLVCHFYRPWMRPLASTVYFFVSIVTVLIGFYDLYKNVPVLKATAAHIFGPLAEWIDSWEMVSRLKYLGTMLILQNFEKAFSYIVIGMRAARQLSQLVMRPVAEPVMLIAEFFLPMWTAVMEVLMTSGMLMWTLLSSVHTVFSSLLGTLTWPIFLFLHTIWNLGVALVYPIFSAIWGLLTLPLQLIKSFVNLVSLLSTGIVEVVLNGWMAMSSTVKLLAANGAPAVTSLRAAKSFSPVPSLWRTLWNDIFSKVFRAVKSIIQGLAAFSASCNRHRLSMYNNVVAFLFRMACIFHSGRGAAVSAYRQVVYHAIRPGAAPDSLLEMEAEIELEHEHEHGYDDDNDDDDDLEVEHDTALDLEQEADLHEPQQSLYLELDFTQENEVEQQEQPEEHDSVPEGVEPNEELHEE